MTRHTTVRLPDDLAGLVDSIVAASVSTPEVPRLSQSEALNLLLRSGARTFSEEGYEIDGVDLMELIPTHELVLYRRDRFRESEAQFTNLRTGFEARTKRHFKKRFKNGIRPEQLRTWSENMREDARILFPLEDDEERLEECLSYVDALEDECVHAIEDSAYDPLDPETVFSVFSEVERGREQIEAARNVSADLVEDARRLLETGSSSGGTRSSHGHDPVSPWEAVDKLSTRSGVSEPEATEAVDRALGDRRLEDSDEDE